MKNVVKSMAIVLLNICLSLNTIAQNCAGIGLKKGSVITMTSQMYQRDYSAMKVYMKLSKKEQLEADENFAKDVESGKIVLPTTEIVSTVDDVTVDSGTTNFQLSNHIKGVVYKTRMFCKNDVLVIAPYKDETLTQVPTGKGDSITVTTVSGYNKIPLSLKVGDALPEYQDLTFTSPYHTEYSGWSTHLETAANGDVWKISTPTTNTIDITTSTITKYVNREVLAAEDVVINGIIYKAFKIGTEIWTKATQKVTASALGVTLIAPAVQKSIDKKTHKALGANSEGYTVSSYTDWYVPSLGLSVKREIYDFKGNLFSKLAVKDIK